MTASKIIGKATPRIEGADKVSGKALYTGDICLSNMLWAKAVRSPIPAGRIKHIDTSKAARLAGVRAIVTGDEVTGQLIGRRIYDMPLLADGLVRFIGEKVAAVAAENEALAEAAVDLIEVEYEDATPLLDPMVAARTDAPLLHPAVQSYRGLLHPLERPSNVFIDMSWSKGDVELGFRQADLIVENTFTTQPVHQAYIEPHACVVEARPAGGGDVWACSKVPFALRDQVANALQRPTDEFVVHTPFIGGCFGGKGDFMDVPICYLLSLKSGRPVKMIMDYGEEFIAGNPRHGAMVKVKSGVKRDGRIVAHQLEFLFDSGAYAAFKPQGYLYGPQESAGPYKIPNVRINEKIVYTNKIPCGHMRAPGDPQGFFANESQMDLIARRLGMNPITLREKNFLHDGDTSPNGHVIPHIRCDETVETAVKASGYRTAKRKHVGRGLAVAQWLPLGGEAHARVTIDANGKVVVATAMADQGAGTYTAMRQIVANELHITVDQVRFEILATDVIGADTGVGASRATRIFGHAAQRAAVNAWEQLLDAAVAAFHANRHDIHPTGDGFLRIGKRKFSYADVVTDTGSSLVGTGDYKDFTVGPQAALCVQVAEVEVDEETGMIAVHKFTTVHSTGQVINPLLHQGQIDGGVVMALGYATMEQLAIEEGRVVTTNFGENKIPSIKDIPRLKTVISEIPIGNGPYGGMSIGEPPVIPTAAAVANAVHDAIGVRIYDLPITAEKIFAALRAR